MTLRLSAEDAADYLRRSNLIEADKQAALAGNDASEARKCRQAQSRLYLEFERRQLPPPPPSKWEVETAMSLEDRVRRIEEHLKLGQFADDF